MSKARWPQHGEVLGGCCTRGPVKTASWWPVLTEGWQWLRGGGEQPFSTPVGTGLPPLEVVGASSGATVIGAVPMSAAKRVSGSIIMYLALVRSTI
jgi:hypothetical protein